jgi:hypothetical protein
MRQNTIPEVLLEQHKLKQHSRTLFPGAGTTNPLPPNFGSLFVFQNFFKKKNSTGHNHN